jgi:hypothetical protein
MTIKIGDICHLKNYYGNYWIGKVIEIHKKIDDYEFRIQFYMSQLLIKEFRDLILLENMNLKKLIVNIGRFKWYKSVLNVMDQCTFFMVKFGIVIDVK